MKKFFGVLGIAFLGGIISLGGYTKFFNKHVVIERTFESPIQTVNASYKPALNTEVVNAISTDFTEAAERSVHAVVHVKNTAIKTQQSPLDMFFGNNGGSKTRKQVGTGSGVIISTDGYIITNNHVINGANELEITLNNKQKYKAELIGKDEGNDIALLKIDADFDLPSIPFANSDNLKIGEWVLAVGNPYNLTSTVTAGIVSAKGRDLEGNGNNVESFIQTDAAVNPGNSGGALVNTRGELVGINTAITSKTGSFIGYSFAVPSNIAKKVIDDLLEFGAVQEAVIGIQYNPSEDEKTSGVKIVGVEEGQGAANAGFKKDDIIVKINNIEITKFSELRGQLTAKRPGDFVKVTVDRDGDLMTKNVKLTKRVKSITTRTFGWKLKDLTKKELVQRNVKNGVKIESVNDSKNNLTGFIITKINNKEVNSAEETARLIDGLASSRYSNNIIELINLQGERERFRF